MKPITTKTVEPLTATKASRGTAHVWVAGKRIGIGQVPNVNAKGEGSHVLTAIVAALAAEGFTTRVTWYR